VGSTAVPGLVSKPILDVAVGLAPKATEEAVVASLESAGYEFRGDKGDDGGLLFILTDAPNHRLAHLHAVRYSDNRWQRYVAFRDLLRAQPNVRRAYAELKRSLAARHRLDRGSYTDAKAAFIEQAVKDQEQ